MKVILKAVVFVGLIFSSMSAYSNDVCNCKGYAGVGGPCYAGVGGPCYSGIGGTGASCPKVCK